jgi:secondary thiamine-phosphate synthase enzyme
MQTTFTVQTTGPGLYEFTEPVTDFVRASGSGEGLLTLFVQHTSCSLCIQENADPDVRRDLDEFFRRLVPASDDPSMRWVRHTTEVAANQRSAPGRASTCSSTATGHKRVGWWDI